MTKRPRKPRILEGVTPAPKWLVKRMKEARKLPRPTLKEVEEQFKAAREKQ